LNETYKLVSDAVKKGGAPKSLIKEQIQLIKDSHKLISSIIKQKSKETKKFLNKKIKNVSRKNTKP
jgi:hypothetical protein